MMQEEVNSDTWTIAKFCKTFFSVFPIVLEHYILNGSHLRIYEFQNFIIVTILRSFTESCCLLSLTIQTHTVFLCLVQYQFVDTLLCPACGLNVRAIRSVIMFGWQGTPIEREQVFIPLVESRSFSWKNLNSYLYYESMVHILPPQPILI